MFCVYVLHLCMTMTKAILPGYSWFYITPEFINQGLIKFNCSYLSYYLLKNRPNDFEWQWAELVLFKEVIEVLLQHLKHQAGVAAVLKTLQSTYYIVLICILAAQTGQDLHLGIAEQ